MLRDPVDLVLSFYPYEHLNLSQDLSCLSSNDSNDSMDTCKQMWEGGNIKSWIMLDNFMVRNILGLDRLLVSHSGVTEHHVEEVIGIISHNFDIVLLLDELNETESRAMLALKLGWNLSAAPIPKVRPLDVNKGVYEHINLSENLLQRLKSRLRADYMLYEHLKKLPVSLRGRQANFNFTILADGVEVSTSKGKQKGKGGGKRKGSRKNRN
eukprot:TRINITY_DN49759_c0_g1_i1.p1 TRINITY_DN49759_c0_g1~~TRINITY_DN49759_c0_g1_i1.p1  ORF type:complete len:211 (-),score=28.24 TRINITY_DN49759_c0_g1_i1:187-819(-)